MKKHKLILGAIAGDIIGSRFERKNLKSTEFELFTEDSDFTDDTILTVATMDALLNNKPYEKVYQEFGRKYDDRVNGYGKAFREWIYLENPEPYNSYGNGSAMRVSPIAWFCNYQTIMYEAARSAEVTHSHVEGVKGARAVAAAIFLAKEGCNKSQILRIIEGDFGYNLSRTIDEIRPDYKFDVSCQGTVPEAIIAFLESENFEHAIRLAISIGGDSDTIAAITGSIAEAFYGGIPKYIEKKVLKILAPELRQIVEAFSKEVL